MASKSGDGRHPKVKPRTTQAGEARRREREARLAAALRENLRRRKTDADGRKAGLAEADDVEKDG